MNRRKFLKSGIAVAAASTIVESIAQTSIAGSKINFDKLLNAYYFRAHMYTLVPKHVREDMAWMAGIGTQAVTIAVLEQDLYASQANIEIIANEAARFNMKLFVVPSRWGGIVAGAPKVPSHFTIMNPQTWMKKKDGSFVGGVSGRISSIHYPETTQFFMDSLDLLFKIAPVEGIIWDEPKVLMPDYSELAIQNMGDNQTFKSQLIAVAGFFSDVNKHIKIIKPNCTTNLFLYAEVSDDVMNTVAENSMNLDYYGCDGRPWYESDGGQMEGKGKNLLGPGERFINVAKNNNMKSLWLIENHNMAEADESLLDKRMPEIVSKKPNHLIYYYYPRNLKNPDTVMNIMAKHLITF